MLLLCLGACTDVVQVDWAPPTNAAVDTTDNADTAAKLAWLLLRGDDSRFPLVHWVVDGPCLGGVEAYPGACHSGWYHYNGEGTDTPHEIWCIVAPLTDPANALVHELTHAVLMDTEGNSDGQHLGARWADVQVIQSHLVAVGL